MNIKVSKDRFCLHETITHISNTKRFVQTNIWQKYVVFILEYLDIIPAMNLWKNLNHSYTLILSDQHTEILITAANILQLQIISQEKSIVEFFCYILMRF